jgi:hypothetical protein
MATYTKYLFSVTGGFDVDDKWTPVQAAGGEIVGFRRPDGTTVEIAICLRTEKAGREKFLTAEAAFDRIGFTCLDYGSADFFQGDPVEDAD